MRLACAKASRLPAAPRWAILFTALWLALVGVVVALDHRRGTETALCPMRRLTGVPCPTCGTTRGLLALARGWLGESVAWNPLMILSALAGMAVLALRMASGRTLRLDVTRSERRALVGLAAAALLVDWLYLLWHVY